MRSLVGLVFAASYVNGQCSKASPPFTLNGVNDQIAVCVIPPNEPLDLGMNDTVPDTTICSLACDSGFNRETVNSRIIKCVGTDWVSTANLAGVCDPLVCPDLPAPIHSPCSTCSGATEGATCTMNCDIGFAPNIQTPRVCRGGVWSGIDLTCTPKVCPTLVPPADSAAGSTACVGKLEGQDCTWSCNSSATTAGSTTRTCSDGMWDGTPLTCTLPTYCPQLYSPAGAYPGVCARATENTTCTFTAMPGYTIQNATRTCQANLTWDGVDATTMPLSCPPLDVPDNAETSTACLSGPEGTKCTQQCRNGYVSNNQGAYTCHNSKWVGTPLVCSPQNCPLLTSPDNAYTSSCDNAIEGAWCTFACKPGFAPTGHATRVCHGGAWSGFSFQCLAPASQYSWVASSFGPCHQNGTTESCGNDGLLTRVVGCVDTQATPYNSVSIALCNASLGAHEVSTVLQCAIEACPTYSWQFGAWSSCSAECGGGYQLRSAVCMSSTGASADASKCPVEAIVGRQACNTQACTGPHWAASEWDLCSGGCYDGVEYNTRTRALFCLDVLGNSAPVAQCRNPAPPASEQCNLQPCAGYLWDSCPWEACTAQCNGGGTKAGLMAGQRQRNVFCKDGSGNTVSSSLCTYVGLPAPATMMVGCNPDPCTAYNWMTGPWSQCTGTGTQGTRTRTYHCHAADGSNALNSACPPPAPPTQEACIPKSCPTMAPTTPGSSRPTPADAVSGAAQIAASVLAIIPIIIAA